MNLNATTYDQNATLERTRELARALVESSGAPVAREMARSFLLLDDSIVNMMPLPGNWMEPTPADDEWLPL
jgi:hypothetical protein